MRKYWTWAWCAPCRLAIQRPAGMLFISLGWIMVGYGSDTDRARFTAYCDGELRQLRRHIRALKQRLRSYHARGR